MRGRSSASRGSNPAELMLIIGSLGARGVMFIVVGNGHSDKSLNPGRG